MKNLDDLDSQGIRYAASFKERLFRAPCMVELVVDLITGKAEAHLQMTQLLSSQPALRISLEALQALSQDIKAIAGFTHLLDAPFEGANDQQLNLNRGGATLVIVRPKGKDATYALTIGTFHREGKLADLDTSEIDEAIARLEEKRTLVLGKISTQQ